MTDPAGFKTFADDVVLTASEINGYLMQGILVFADSAARDTALSGSLAEGRYCYLKDTNTTYVYTGSSWEAVTGSAPPTVSGTTGSPSTGTGKGGRSMYTWTGNGSITFATAGTIRCTVVGGGRSGVGVTTSSGGGGQVLDVSLEVIAGTYTVTIGAGGAYMSGSGGASSVKLAANASVNAKGGDGFVTPINNGDGGYAADSAGVYSDISGTSVGYGGAGYFTPGQTGYNSAFGGAQSAAVVRANSGGGGNEVGSGNGAAGVVQILV